MNACPHIDMLRSDERKLFHQESACTQLTRPFSFVFGQCTHCIHTWNCTTGKSKLEMKHQCSRVINSDHLISDFYTDCDYDRKWFGDFSPFVKILWRLKAIRNKLIGVPTTHVHGAPHGLLICSQRKLHEFFWNTFTTYGSYTRQTPSAKLAWG